MFASINFQEILSAFIVLFAVIDIIGSIPIIINIKQNGRQINAFAAASLSFLLMIIFFFAGEILALFPRAILHFPCRRNGRAFSLFQYPATSQS